MFQFKGDRGDCGESGRLRLRTSHPPAATPPTPPGCGSFCIFQALVRGQLSYWDDPGLARRCLPVGSNGAAWCLSGQWENIPEETQAVLSKVESWG